MNIRKATQEDISEIIEVLKASMGEADLPLSEEIWRYKHFKNPFGPSPVFVAEEEGRIAGVRAFMQWTWQRKGEVYSAYRAVDTATHPDFQGRGIFKKLTLKAVESGVNNNYNFVFNTPNEKSRPGYLKMGWIKTGKVKVALKPSFNFFFNEPSVSYEVEKKFPSSINLLCENWNHQLRVEGKLFTPKTEGFLEWRYEKNPLQQYEIYSGSSFYLAGYIKRRGRIRELRIAECITTDNNEVQGEIRNVIRQWSKKFSVQVISYSPDIFLSLPLSVKGKFGPVLTLRKLNLSASDYGDLGEVENWKYSLGDLELF